MSISGIGYTATSSLFSLEQSFKQRTEAFQALKSALQSGDLSAAKTAYANFLEDIQKSKASPPTSDPSASSDLKSLQAGLNSGDISAALQAFASFQAHTKAADETQRDKHQNVIDIQPQTVTGDSETVGTILDHAA